METKLKFREVKKEARKEVAGKEAGKKECLVKEGQCWCDHSQVTTLEYTIIPENDLCKSYFFLYLNDLCEFSFVYFCI